MSRRPRLYISDREMAALARGEVTPRLAAKAKARIKPPEPIPGQLNIIDALEEDHAYHESQDVEARAASVRNHRLRDRL